MKKNRFPDFAIYYLFSLIFLFLFNLIFPLNIKAQEIQQAQSWDCLKPEQLSSQGGNPPSNALLKLTGNSFPNDKDVYIALCIPTKDKTICSTSSSKYDKELFGADFTSAISFYLEQSLERRAIENKDIEGAFSFQINPVITKPTEGKVTSMVTVYNPLGHIEYSFYGIQKIDMQEESTASKRTMQFNTFKPVMLSNNGSKCNNIVWDPYGRVFDSQSLEPIPNIGIKILNSITPEKLVQIPDNPQT